MTSSETRILKGPVGLAALLLLIGAVSVFAQGEPPLDTPEESTLTLWRLIMQGGVTMIPLAALSIAGVTLAVLNFLALKEDKLLRPDLVGNLRVHLANRDVDGAIRICDNQPGVLPAVVRAGMERITGDALRVDDIREAMEEAGTEQMVSYMRPINYLSVIGSVSPMVGLLGTVSGMIKAFRNISLGGMGKPEVLAANIGEALVTTATGLIIAIPAMIFYFYFKGSFMKTMAHMGRMTGNLLNNLRTGELSAADAAAAPPAAPAAPEQGV